MLRAAVISTVTKGTYDEMHMHAYLAPVRIDRDGSLLIICGVDAWTGVPTHPDGLALVCPDCGGPVSGLLAGSEGVDLDGPDQHEADRWLALETTLADLHAAISAADPLLSLSQ